MRLIDADALYDKAETWYKSAPTPYRLIYRSFVDAIADAPTIAPPPAALLTLEELRGIVEQMEQCGYQCEGGPLIMNRAFIRLKEFAYRRKPKEGTT